MLQKVGSVAQTLFSLRSTFSKFRREERDRMADLFESISKCVSEVGDALELNTRPHTKCAEMRMYAIMFEDMVKSIISPKIAMKLSNDMIAVYDAESLWFNIRDASDEERAQAYQEISEISGKFLALSNILRGT